VIPRGKTQGSKETVGSEQRRFHPVHPGNPAGIERVPNHQIAASRLHVGLDLHLVRSLAEDDGPGWLGRACRTGGGGRIQVQQHSLRRIELLGEYPYELLVELGLHLSLRHDGHPRKRLGFFIERDWREPGYPHQGTRPLRRRPVSQEVSRSGAKEKSGTFLAGGSREAQQETGVVVRPQRGEVE